MRAYPVIVPTDGFATIAIRQLVRPTALASTCWMRGAAWHALHRSGVEAQVLSQHTRTGAEHPAPGFTAVSTGLVPLILSALGTSAPELRTAILERGRQSRGGGCGSAVNIRVMVWAIAPALVWIGRCFTTIRGVRGPGQ